MSERIELLKEKTRHIKKPIIILVSLLFLDSLVFAASFSLNHVFRPDILAMVLYLSLFVYLYLTKRPSDIPYLFLSFALAFFWVAIASKQYGYNREMIEAFGLNSYPLFAWAVGLSALYLLYTDIEQLIFLKATGFKTFLLYTFLYVFFIISLETIAYHVFNIKNAVTAMYSGLPICDCIHAPHWMQISYFLIGPIHFLLCRYYKLKITRWM